MEKIKENYQEQISQQPLAPPVEIPLNALSTEAMAGVIDNFIFREGTDYGASEVSHESKVNRIHKQLESGNIKIVFDPNEQSVTLITKLDWNKLNTSNLTQ